MLRFLKKMILFCVGYIVVYSIAMIVIFCVKDAYPELLTTVTFAYFSIEIVVSAGIKIFETFKNSKSSLRKTKYDLPALQDEREPDYYEHT